MKAIKTEYKNIVYDSKSEAVFARVLDLAGHRWNYHPSEHCGHVWDFYIFRKQWMPYMFIEYKPAMPTMTYVNNLTETMSVNPQESIIVWGNPWNGIDLSIGGPHECCYRIYPIFSSFGNYGWGNFIPEADSGESHPVSYRHETWDILGITEEMAQDAKSFRFDLYSR